MEPSRVTSSHEQVEVDSGDSYPEQVSLGVVPHVGSDEEVGSRCCRVSKHLSVFLVGLVEPFWFCAGRARLPPIPALRGEAWGGVMSGPCR